MNAHLEKSASWWKEPMVWLIIALPMAAVVAGIVTVAIAARNADTLVQGDFRKEGLTLHQSTERDQLAARLGLSASLRVNDGKLRVGLHGRLDQPPERLALSFVHPTDASRDVRTHLVRLDADQYEGQVGDLGGVGWQVVMEPADNSWRLAGRWSVDQGDTFSLSAGQPDLSTRP